MDWLISLSNIETDFHFHQFWFQFQFSFCVSHFEFHCYFYLWNACLLWFYVHTQCVGIIEVAAFGERLLLRWMYTLGDMRLPANRQLRLTNPANVKSSEHIKRLYTAQNPLCLLMEACPHTPLPAFTLLSISVMNTRLPFTLLYLRFTLLLLFWPLHLFTIDAQFAGI